MSKISEIKKAYLAGGTALALQLGHRISVDLDFFTQEEFNETFLAEKLTLSKKFTLSGTAKWTVWGKISQTKFSMFYYKYPMLEKPCFFEGIKLANLSDIAAMKIHAIEDRGTRRDFTDVYFLSKTYSLEEMFNFYQKKYSVDKDHIYSTLRSLDYFEDAEKEEQMPKMLVKVDWDEIKEFFRKETLKLAKKSLHI